jgi:5-hydroxyisourate hydrolase
VLDTARGTGAGGMRVDVCGPDGVVKTATLDDGGRATLLPELVAGAYEISFHAGAYQTTDFYDVIPVRFNISDLAQHYHIPLILSPFGYSTYRGG